MKDLPGIEITSRILCQDVRREINHKFILIGVYSGDVIVQHFPTTLDFTFYLEAIFETEGNKELHFRILGPEGELAHFSIALQLKNGLMAGFHSPQMKVNYPESGAFIVQVSADKETWHELINRRINQGEVPGAISIAREPPSEQSQSDDQD